MEKDTYETFEYVPSNNAETDCDQFYIIEDDGSFLTVHKPVQYVAQVQEGPSALDNVQPNQVHSVPSQQFLANDKNSTELSAPDNLVLPNGSGSLYGNNYFIQTVANTNDQVKHDVVSNKFRQTDMQMDATGALCIDSKQNTTEIMLTDVQYSILERKGWILLESNNKIFILDTTGLQEITNNHELIQQLKAELQSEIELYSRSNNENDLSEVKLERATSPSEPKTETKYETESNLPKATKSLNKALFETYDIEETAEIDVVKNEKEMLRRKHNIRVNTVGDTIKIKTKLLSKDIPDKIILGKTINGKKLVAKLIPKQVSKKTESSENTPDTPKPKKQAPVTQPDANVSYLPNWQFNALVEHVQSDEMKCSEEHVAAAKDVVAQLLQVAAFQRAVAGKNLFISRAVKNKSANAHSERVTQSVVTGIITEIDGQQRFVHIPNMMQNLSDTGDKDPHNITHVHVTETKQQNSTQTISITVNKRPLPPISAKGKRHSKVYACSTCATIFTSEKELLDHQEAHCIDAEDSLMINAEGIVNYDGEQMKISPYCIMKTDKGIIYSCLICPLKFNKLCNCQRHVKTHYGPTTQTVIDTNKCTESENKYKCKMCSSSYYYASTLSKHIVATHINVNSGSISDNTSVRK